MAFLDVPFIKANYPAGTRIELISTSDPFASIYPGDKGTVDRVDDAGTIHIRWDDGAYLGLICDKDSFKKIEEDLNTYRVWAKMTDYVYADIKAKSKEEAIDKAVEMDDGEFIPTAKCGWEIMDEATEVINGG